MRIATADPPARWRPLLRRVDPRQRRHARLELLGLAVVTIVIATGFWTTYQRQVSTFADMNRDLTTGAVVQPGASPPSALAEKLTMFPSAAERRVAGAARGEILPGPGGVFHPRAPSRGTPPPPGRE